MKAGPQLRVALRNTINKKSLIYRDSTILFSSTFGAGNGGTVASSMTSINCRTLLAVACDSVILFTFLEEKTDSCLVELELSMKDKNLSFDKDVEADSIIEVKILDSLKP